MSRWVALILVLVTAACLGWAVGASETDQDEREWRQIAGDAGYSNYIPGELRPPLRVNVHERGRLDRLHPRTVLAASGDVLYAIEPERIRALNLDRKKAYPYATLWEVFVRGGYGSRLLPPKIIAHEIALVFPSRGRGPNTESIVGLDHESGVERFRIANTSGVVGLGLMMTPSDVVCFKRAVAGSPAVALRPKNGPAVLGLALPGDPDHFGVIPGAPGVVFVQDDHDVVTLDTKTGRKHGSHYVRVGSPVRASAGLMYLTEQELTCHGEVWALDRHAKRRWVWKFPGKGICVVRVATPNRVIVEGDGQLWALEPATGKLVWKVAAPVRARKAPGVVPQGFFDRYIDTWSARIAVGDTLFATITSPGRTYVDTIVALDLNTGKRLWSKSFLYSLGSMIVHRGILHCMATSPDGTRTIFIQIKGQ